MIRTTRYVSTLHGWAVLLPVLTLCLISLVTLGAMGVNEGGRTMEIAMRQVGYILAGIGVMFLVLTIHYRRFGEYSYAMFGVLIGLLLLLVASKKLPIPFVEERRGSNRAFALGPINVQPSELMKFVYVLALAYYLRYRKNYRSLGGLVGPFALTLLPTLLILLQPDLGMSLLLLPVLFAMLFVAGAKKRHLLPIVLAGLASVPLFYMFALKDYQKTRIQVLLKQDDNDPRWRQAEGYQLYHAKTALGSGEILGTASADGFAEGPYVKHPFLPDRHNDFIFAIIGHQWGFVGVLAVIACYGLIVLAGIEIASLNDDPFGRLLAVGIVVTLASQALVNIGVTVGLIPTTGLTLPFVSFGGSSMLSNFAAVGLLINVAQRRPIILARKPFEFPEG